MVCRHEPLCFSRFLHRTMWIRGALLLIFLGLWSPRARAEDADLQEMAGAPQVEPGSVAEDPREQELQRIRAEIRRLQGRLAEVRSRESSLEDRLQRIRVELELQEAELGEATAAWELASSKVTAAEAKVGELELVLEGIRSDLKRRLAGLYRLGRQGYLRFFLTLKDNGQLLPAIRQLRFLARRDQLTIDRYDTARQRLADERVRLDAERLQTSEWQAREQERRDGLLALRRRQEEVVAEVARERRRLAARALELEEKERKLSRLIGTLLNDSAEPLQGTPIQDFRGVLDWPVRGSKVVVGFGPRKDPRYRTEVPHNGVDLALAPGAEVRAIFPGAVLYADDFEGYGNMVVVHHAGRVFSLYSRLLEVRVKKGDVVSLGDVLGLSADTIYFEVRVENQPEDPLSWLR